MNLKEDKNVECLRRETLLIVLFHKSLDLHMSDSSRAGFPIFSCSSSLHPGTLSPVHVETLLYPLSSAVKQVLHWITKKNNSSEGPFSLCLATKMPPTCSCLESFPHNKFHLKQTLTSIMKQQSQSYLRFYVVPGKLKIKTLLTDLGQFSKWKRANQSLKDSMPDSSLQRSPPTE